MPCISRAFNPDIGPLIRVGIGPPGTMKKLVAGGQPLAPPMIEMLVDTGAAITSVSPEIMNEANIRVLGQRDMGSSSGGGMVNTYAVDLLLPVSESDDDNGSGRGYVVDNWEIVDFLDEQAPFKGLLGRDVLSRGLLVFHGPENVFTFCL